MKHCSTVRELKQIRAALNYTESYWGPTATTSCTQKRPCTGANDSDPLHVCWMNNTFLIRIQAARSFDRWHSSMAAADADVKYMLLPLLPLQLVLKYAGRNSDDTSLPWVVLIFNPSLSECKQRVKACRWWANAAEGGGGVFEVWVKQISVSSVSLWDGRLVEALRDAECFQSLRQIPLWCW